MAARVVGSRAAAELDDEQVIASIQKYMDAGAIDDGLFACARGGRGRVVDERAQRGDLLGSEPRRGEDELGPPGARLQAVAVGDA